MASVVEFVGEQSQKKVGVFDALWRSFFDSNCYVSVARDWSGISVTYLLLLTVLFCSLVVGGMYYRVVQTLSSAEVVSMMEQMPRLHFKNGVMSTASGDRVDLIYPKSGSLFMIVDPRDTVADIGSTGATVLVQSKNVTVHLHSKEPAVIPLSKIYKDTDLDGKQILGQIKSLANATVLPIFLILNIGSFLFILFKSMMLALLLKLLRTRHSIFAATRLIIMATTPSLILSGLSIIAQIHFGKAESGIFTGIFFGYVWLAFFFCRKEDIVGK
ncbi:MAG: DUF1189 family protein [Candidatus Obscuribacterales bacterium]|jgi:hypothetical protein|nr:DUF1189 family protein [Candidatus Obscuribacterales bacterium]